MTDTSKPRFGPERFFIPRPSQTLPFEEPHPVPGDKLLVWSGARALPELNEVVHTPFGRARVEGFFASSGFVGVMVAPERPPKWWIEENAERAALPITEDNPEWLSRLACFYGAELKED